MLVPPFDLVTALADRQLHRRLVHDAVVDALEPVIEEAQLIAAPLVGIERVYVRAGVNAKLLVRGCRTHESFGVAAQMQAHARPVADAEHRHGDLVPLRLRAAERAAVETVAEPEMQRIGLPGVRVMPRRPTHHVMHQVRDVPVGHEQAEQAAVEQRVAVEIGETLPRDDRLQRRRLLIGRKPLVDGEVGDAGESDLARAPGLRRRPFDRVVEINRLRERPWLALPGRFAAAAAVDPHRGVALRHPPFRIDGLPVHQRVRLFLQAVRRNPQLVLLVRTQVQDGGKPAGIVRPEDVGFQPGAVAHRHVDILLDHDAVDRHGGSRLHFHCCCLPALPLLPLSYPAARPSPDR